MQGDIIGVADVAFLDGKLHALIGGEDAPTEIPICPTAL